MALNDQQLKHYKILTDNYTETLSRVRTDILAKLKTADTPEEKNKIWQASFTLSYMIENHKKYCELLRFLNRKKQTQILLENVFEKLRINPEDDLQGFIEQAQTILQDNKFQKRLVNLFDDYYFNQKLNVELIGSIIFVIFVAITIVSILFVIPSVPYIIALAITIGFMDFSVLAMTFAGISDINYKQSEVNRFFDSLEDNRADYTLNETYSYYKTQNDDDGATTTLIRLNREHPSCSTDTLKQRFFQVQESEKPLNVLVQEKFDAQKTCFIPKGVF